jgi:sensor histidine kinase regulating citrate/malate metabolism
LVDRFHNIEEEYEEIIKDTHLELAKNKTAVKVQKNIIDSFLKKEGFLIINKDLIITTISIEAKKILGKSNSNKENHLITELFSDFEVNKEHFTTRITKARKAFELSCKTYPISNLKLWIIFVSPASL